MFSEKDTFFTYSSRGELVWVLKGGGTCTFEC